MACWTPILPPTGAAERNLVLWFAKWERWYAARQALEDRVGELGTKMRLDIGTFAERRKWTRQKEVIKARLGDQRTQYDSWSALAPFTCTTPDKDMPWVRDALGLDGPVAAAGHGPRPQRRQRIAPALLLIDVQA